MSLTDKFASLMQRPGQDPQTKDDVPLWMRYAGRSLGTVGSLIAIFFGLWNCLGILTADVDSLISGMWQIVAGFLLACCEAPCCCMFIDFVQSLSDWVDKRPYWNKALVYVLLAIPAIIIYPSVGSILGSGLIFTTGVIYGMMALGRKASRQDMAAMASPQMATSPSGLLSQGDPRSTLMEDPDVWRPT